MTAVVAALIFNPEGEILICQRRPDQEFPRRWEFPGGKIEPGETPQRALKRELQEELGAEAEIGGEVSRIHHEYRNGPEVELRFFLVRLTDHTIKNEVFQDARWVAPGALPDYDFLEADRKLVQEIAAGSIRPTARQRQKHSPQIQ